VSDESGLFLLFQQARGTGMANAVGQTVQWLSFPPPLEELGVEGPLEVSRFLKRRRMFPTQKPTWSTIPSTSRGGAAAKLKLEMDQYLSTGWEFFQPVVVQLPLDDYLKLWKPGKAETPYKVLRHVEAVTVKQGYRLTGDAV
jgi:hypothetical protein